MAVVETAPAQYPKLDLSPEQELALLARVLYHEGYDDHLAGLLSYKQPDGTFLVNPFMLPFDELHASDICRMDADGNHLGGNWVTSPALLLLRSVHAARADAAVVVHSHPRYGTIWADSQRPPLVYDQTGTLFSGEVACYSEYGGPVSETENASGAVNALGSANALFLRNHGVLVVGRSIADAYRHAMSLEARCRRAWEVEALGDGAPMPTAAAASLAAYVDTLTDYHQALFQAMARRVVKADPSVLD
jgi:ribulose-5-phosphate 4-epimerase/fuculose-1-phosphate aldolase